MFFINNIQIINTLITLIIGGFIGFILNSILQKRSNKREKLKEINNTFLKEIRLWINIIKNSLVYGTYVIIPESENKMAIIYDFKVKYLEIEKVILKFDIFEKSGEDFLLSYKSDKTLKEHSKKIITLLSTYKRKEQELERIFNEINNWNIPSQNFESKISELLLTIKRSINDLKGPNKNKDFQKIIFSVIIGNPQLIRGGHTAMMELLQHKFLELEQIVAQDQNFGQLYQQVKNTKTEMISILKELEYECIKIHNEWRDEYHI